MGVMLYLLLTGCFLFDGEDEWEFPSYLSAVTQVPTLS